MPTSASKYHFLLSLFTGFINLLAGIFLSIGVWAHDPFIRFTTLVLAGLFLFSNLGAIDNWLVAISP